LPEFLTLIPPAEALQEWLAHVNPLSETETVATSEAFDRVNAEELFSPEELPAFARSTMDGYALRARDSHGASQSQPQYLELIAEVRMGEEPSFAIGPGQCAKIHTGGMLPEGTDAVLMLEHSQIALENQIEVFRSLADGENVILAGEDLQIGQSVLPQGQSLGAAEIGGLMALGMTELKVTRRPIIGIISTGDEVIPPEEMPGLGQVRDVNSYSLASLIQGEGGAAKRFGIFSDNEKFLVKSANEALQNCDALIISAGSSASARDLTSTLITALGKPGVLVHGINLRPGKPTILGICNGKPIIGLPGNPVSALVVARLFVRALVHKLLGLQSSSLRPQQVAKLTINLASQSGREDWVAVRVIEGDDGFSAEPIFGQSNLIFTLVQAGGLVRIPANRNGLSAGEEVLVHGL
jgi:molybdopterin molybdotransferase